MMVSAVCPEIDLTLRASLIICMLSVSAWVEEGGTSWGNDGVISISISIADHSLRKDNWNFYQ